MLPKGSDIATTLVRPNCDASPGHLKRDGLPIPGRMDAELESEPTTIIT